jgi:hypothetical protein
MRLSFVGLALAVVLSGCSTSPTTDDIGSPLPSSTLGAEFDNSPSPSPSEPVIVSVLPVDPSAYATKVAVHGVDFDSADHNFHCGIFDDLDYQGPVTGAGCVVRSLEYQLPIVPYLDGTSRGTAVLVNRDKPGVVMAYSGATYAGEDPMKYPDTRVLENGTSVNSVGFTCEAIDFSINCSSDVSGHGFKISRATYEIF